MDREVKDPTTKEVLDRITTKVGEMTITSVRDKIATGTYSGAPAKVGYLARKKILINRSEDTMKLRLLTALLACAATRARAKESHDRR